MKNEHANSIYTVVIQESKNALINAESDFNALQKQGESIEKNKIETIRRAFHTIKGDFSFFGKENICIISKTIENILKNILDGKTKLTPELIEAIMKGKHKIIQMLEKTENIDSLEIDTELNLLNQFLENE